MILKRYEDRDGLYEQPGGSLVFFDDLESVGMLLQSAKHLLLGAKGSETGPTSWIETRDRWLAHAETIIPQLLPSPATQKDPP